MVVSIVRDPADPVAGAEPVRWAVERLQGSLVARGVATETTDRIGDGPGTASTVVVSGPVLPVARAALVAAGVPIPGEPEAFALLPRAMGADNVLACGADVRGLVYAVLELADRVEHAVDPLEALQFDAPIFERPTNAVRSVMRLFSSEAADKAWFHDEGFWPEYLSELVAQRFNRFSLTLGLGYNYHWGVTDAYLYFAYPFLLDVPGYHVRVPQLPDEERDRNLHMLRYVSEQAAARGLEFQLGLWTHAYEWLESPDAVHTVEGLTPETHAAYCRDAVAMLLDECPAIGGLTFRTHGESGVPERSWPFWRTVFEAVTGAGRTVRLDLHAKGLDAQTLQIGLETGMPVTVSPKYWAEHMGLPYHQAAIRELERPAREDPSHFSEWHRYMAVSEGSRPFTRYGYGDFLRDDRSYDVVFRLWPGTQRLLLWGDPAIAAGYGRHAGIGGSRGLELFEPLTFRGREGSGLEGTRDGYADASLVPERDWHKYRYTYRLFGRLTYDPDAPAETWRRALRADFGSAAEEAEAALASASRILPLVTVAHHPSASNNYYWPELYTDMPIVWSEEGTRPHPYLDTPTPRRFGTVSPLDPEVFSSVTEFVEELRAGEPSGRVSPLDVARLLDGLAEDAARRLAVVEDGVPDPDAEVRRWEADIAILAALGRFFAGKLRSAVCYELHAETGSREALRCAVEAYRTARSAWLSASGRAEGVYVPDLTFGPQQRIRGHWADRILAIDADLRDMEDRWNAASVGPVDEGGARHLLDTVARPLPDVEVLHAPPAVFRPDMDLPLEIQVRGPDAPVVERVTLRYRSMNQELPFEALTMDRAGEGFTARITAGALERAYPLAYAFVLRDAGERAWRHPSLGADLSAQPYFVARPEHPLPAPGMTQ